MLLASQCKCKYSAAPSPPLSIEASNIFIVAVALVAPLVVTEITESAFTYFFFSQPS
jgi:hypothetical protein